MLHVALATQDEKFAFTEELLLCVEEHFSCMLSCDCQQKQLKFWGVCELAMPHALGKSENLKYEAFGSFALA